MSSQFQDKIYLVTGGTSGIGFATAKRLVGGGARVIVTGRDPQALEAARLELGATAEAIRADVADLGELKALFAHIRTAYGRLDGVVANAGVAKFEAVEDVTEASFDGIFDVNVKGAFFTLQHAMPLLGRGASVVLTGSVAGSRGTPTTSVYGASKAALRSFARTFAAAYTERGVRFNVVSPGPIETPIWHRPGSVPGGHVQETKKAVAAGVPMARYGTPEEVAGPIAFLLSQDAAYVTGAELFVDGGMNQL